MGNKVATFREEQLDDYQDCTYFTRKEILRVYRRFRELDAARVPLTMSDEAANSVSVPAGVIERLPELRENPFRRRILRVFSRDGSGDLTFNDFLNMFSVFSERAPRELKSIYAFRIYDFNDDDFLSPPDLLECLRLLTGGALTPQEAATVCEKIIEETDIDDDGKLSFMEFDHVISRSTDFLANFHIRI